MLPMAFVFVDSAVLNNQYKEIEKRNRMTTLLRISSVMDANLSNIRSVGQLIVNDAEMQSLMDAQAPLDSYDLVDIFHLKKTLVSQQVLNSLIDEIVVYFPKSNSILCTQGLYKNGEFAGSCDALLGTGYDVFLGLCSFSGNFHFSFYPRTDGYGFAIVCKYYADANRPLNAVVVLTLDESAFEQLTVYARGDSQQNGVLLLNTDGEGVFGQGDALPAHLKPEDVVQLQEKISVTDTDLVFWTSSSVSSSLRYVTSIPLEQFSALYRPKLTPLYVMMIACGLAGVLIIVLGIKKQYSPVRALYQNLLQRKHCGEKEYRNEYCAIQRGVDDMLLDIENSHKHLSESNRALRHFIMERLIRGKYPKEDELWRICANYDLNLKPGIFVVILIAPDDFVSLVNNDAEQESGYSSQLVNDTVGAFMKKKIQERFRYESVIVNDYLCGLINADAGMDIQPEIRSMLSTLVQCVEEKYFIKISIAVGSIRSAGEIGASWRDANATMEYMQITSISDHVLFHSKIACASPQSMDWLKDVELQKTFYNCMMLGNYQDAYDALKGMLEAYDYQGVGEDIALWKSRWTLIVHIISDAFGRSPLKACVTREMAALKRARTAAEMKQALRDLFDLVIARMETENEKSPSLHENMIAYIEQNFASPSISIASIADAFGISVSYASRYFKSEMGVGMLDYIHMMRINHAEEMLKSTHKNVKNIAEEVGYISCLTMSRAFRRYEGVTPSEYRELHKQ